MLTCKRGCPQPVGLSTSVRPREVDSNNRLCERGSALVLIPVLVVIIVFAAGLVIDSAVAFSAKRALVEVASAAANDAANALDDDPLYSGGNVRLDNDLANRMALNALTGRTDGLEHLRLVSTSVSVVDGRPVVTVVVSGKARPVFGVLPGVDLFDITATARSTTWRRA